MFKITIASNDSRVGFTNEKQFGSTANSWEENRSFRRLVRIVETIQLDSCDENVDTMISASSGDRHEDDDIPTDVSDSL